MGQLEIGLGAPVEVACTTVVNVSVLVEAFYLFACRSLTRSTWALGLFSNPLLVGGITTRLLAQAAFTHWPVANRLFHSAPLGWDS